MYLTRKSGAKYYALDIETDSLKAERIYVCCVEDVDTNQRWTFTDAGRFNAFWPAGAVAVGHNAISFDVPVLRRLWGSNIRLSETVDTLVLSLLYNPRLPRPEGYTGRAGAHSLKAWGYRLGEHKIDFDDWSELTEDMIEYCRQDVAVTVKLYHALCSKMNSLGYSEKSAKIEHQFRHLIDKQETSGFAFNRLRANMLYQRLRSNQSKIETEVRSFFPPKRVIAGEYEYRVKKDGEPVSSFLRHQEQCPDLVFNKSGTRYRTFEDRPFNLGSPMQRAERLLDLGWKPKRVTAKGSPQVDEASVLEFADQSGNQYVRMIADWLVHNGRANMIKTWLDALQPDSRIHGTVMSCGAGSRRCTHSSPNTANIPSSSVRFGQDCRSLWVPSEGNVLVGVDAKGLEGRVFVHYLDNPTAEEFMMNDPHTKNAQAVSEAVGFDVSRSLTKNIFYGRLYGASDRKLGEIIGKGAKHGKLCRDAIDTNIPGFERLVKSIAREFERNSGRLQTIDGGFVVCPGSHASINYKFQSAGAIFMKQALIRFYEMAEGLDFQVVGNIHDEWQIDAKPEHAEQVGQAACRAMTQAGIDLEFNIKMEGDYAIGRNWSETH